LKEVLDYSMRTVQVFVSLLMKRKRSELRATTTAIRYAHNADGKEFKKFLESLGDNDA